jgi:hypothetical protein
VRLTNEVEDVLPTRAELTQDNDTLRPTPGGKDTCVADFPTDVRIDRFSEETAAELVDFRRGEPSDVTSLRFRAVPELELELDREEGFGLVVDRRGGEPSDRLRITSEDWRGPASLCRELVEEDLEGGRDVEREECFKADVLG